MIWSLSHLWALHCPLWLLGLLHRSLNEFAAVSPPFPILSDFCFPIDMSLILSTVRTCGMSGVSYVELLVKTRVLKSEGESKETMPQGKECHRKNSSMQRP